MMFASRLRMMSLCAAVLAPFTASPQAQQHPAFLGMDRNDYPGDANMELLRKTFVFTGYWLNSPPGASRNTWTGKRTSLQAIGFGFLLLCECGFAGCGSGCSGRGFRGIP